MTTNNNPIKYVLVTGGSKGIGKAICTRLAREDCHILTCSRHSEDLQVLKEELSEYSGQILTYQVDLSEKKQVKKFAGEVSKVWDQIDILVNNTGTFQPGSILDEAEGRLEHMMDTNLYSAYHLTRALMPLIRKGNKPHIFNMCSVASQIAYPNGGSYSISKFALLGFSKVLREELKNQGVRVTAILPGATWSDSWKGADLPKDRLMEAQDIAHLVWSAYELSATADVEEITVRPQLGDL
ncbi:MAG: SDR family oxidoreductase [Saprospiraceae bacterium]|nr:SDR family oxidoreductase [Saprospiraceae bacterium]